ncbi:MAG: response regulator, partial [Mariprofundaceae bacterium]|nr:response regulator [Mariprofundaceae bacterium]
PGMDGLEASRAIKCDPELCAIPIIALTALAMQGDEQRILACGCDDYISKPLKAGLLLEKISAALNPDHS